MSQTLSDQGYDAARKKMDDIAVRRLELEKEAALDATQTALGVAGLADPSPMSDGANAAISFARGDYFGFALDGFSAIPYVGDLVAKSIRGVQMGLRAGGRAKKLAAFAKRGSELTEKIVDMRKRAADAAKAYFKKHCKGCNNKYGTKTPKRGRWENPDDKGNGRYEFEGNEYVFKDGYPDFEHPDMQKYLHPDGNNKVQIEMSGKSAVDIGLANKARGIPGPKYYTWHHGDDGSTMYLVRTDHHKAVVPHRGGDSLAKSKLF